MDGARSQGAGLAEKWAYRVALADPSQQIAWRKGSFIPAALEQTADLFLEPCQS